MPIIRGNIKGISVIKTDNGRNRVVFNDTFKGPAWLYPNARCLELGLKSGMISRDGDKVIFEDRKGPRCIWDFKDLEAQPGLGGYSRFGLK